MSNTININQFAPTPVLGDLDLTIAQSQTISGIISANQATALTAGTPVVLDSAILTGNVPQFKAAADSDVAIGYIKRTVQAATFSAGDEVEIVGDFGPVMFLLAQGTVAMGDLVDQYASDPTAVVTHASAKIRGIALDPGTTGQLIRVIILDPVAAAV